MSIALTPGTDDELSTYSIPIGDKPQRTLRQATFTAHKLDHIDKYMAEFDEDAWNADIDALK